MLDDAADVEQWLSVVKLVREDVEGGLETGVGIFAGGVVGALVGLATMAAVPVVGAALVLLVVVLVAITVTLTVYFGRRGRVLVGLAMGYECSRSELLARE